MAKGVVEKLDALIRTGDFAAVVRSLHLLNPRKIPREEKVALAQIANRADQPKFALQALESIIRSDKTVSKPATESEKIEYAEALRRCGLVEEAKTILGEINAQQFPVVNMRMAFCLFTQWRYDQAIEYLRKYMSAVDRSEYSFTIARVNLAAAMVIERMDSQALELLTELVVETKRANYQLLHGNCLEMIAQVHIHQGKLDLADQALNQAEVVYSDSGTRYSFYLRKWRAILRSLKAGFVHPDLLECRVLAERTQDFDTQRECDLYIGHLTQDHELLAQVYFGTPHQSYRRRILELAGKDFAPAEKYIWYPAGREVSGTVLNTLGGRISVFGRTLTCGSLPHRMLLLLARDFYQPVSVGSAFSELFPGEHFLQRGSNHRVYQVVLRLRQWLDKQGGDFSVTEQNGKYRLCARPGCGIEVCSQGKTKSGPAVIWANAIRRLPPGLFTTRDLMAAASLSNSTAKRLLRWSESAGHVEAISGGPFRRYRLCG